MDRHSSVVILDSFVAGKSQGGLVKDANYLQTKANVIVVGVNGAHNWQTNVIASDHGFNLFEIPNFNHLNQITETLKDAVCFAASTGIYEH